jgi:predicted RNA-binding Zn-ribbon protein involved in translation (DUF1610 family)
MTTATATHTTREAWMLAAVPALVELITKAGGPEFIVPLVSVGFPYRARGSKKGGKAIGQCWTIPGDKGSHVFVHPCLDEPVRVLDVLLHELIHASVGLKCGHRGRFKHVATQVGLVGEMTATVAGEALEATLKGLAEDLGAFPHRKLDPTEATGAGNPKKQGTRMRKYTCPHCGQIIRAACDDLEATCKACTDDAEDGEPVLFELEEA